MKQRITLITLGVDDLARSLAFYRALGWEEHPYSAPGEIAFFQAGGLVFALWDRAKLADDTGVSDTGGWGGITLAHNVETRAEVDEILATAEAAGATVARAAGETFFGGYTGIFLDPDGHAWEVAQVPDMTVHPDGSMSLPG